MAYWFLNEVQAAALIPVVSGRVVHDLGAGDLSFAHQLLDLGAARVVAIDKEPKPRRRHDLGIEYYQSYFADYPGTMDVAIVSWPSTNCRGLGTICRRATSIVYLGSNVDGSACGDFELFRGLIKREVVTYVPNRRNTLICYGGPSPTPRPLHGEEIAALLTLKREPIVSFEEAESSLELIPYQVPASY